MKTVTHFLMFIGLVTFTILTSCSNKKNETSNPKKEKKISVTNKDTIRIENNNFFHLPDLQKLVDYSPILKKESFGDGDIRFIVGDALILSTTKQITYLNLLPKTSEDDNYYIHLIVQSWNNGKPKTLKKWTINNESGNLISLQDFYEGYIDEIREILKKEEISFVNQKISFIPYKKDNIILTSTYKNVENEFKELNSVAINSKDTHTILLQKDSKNTFCPECDSLLIYKTDILGEIIMEKQAKKILLIGFLEQIDQSPSALHLRFIDLKE